MSAENPGRSDPPAERVDSERLPDTSVSGVLRESVGRIAADPRLALPFVVAGLALTVVDWFRARDSVPTPSPELVGDVTLSVAYQLYPAGLRATGLRPAALVDLEPAYLVRTLGLELGAFLAVGVAGWLTLSRAAGARSRAANDRPPAQTRLSSGDRLGAYLGFTVVAHVLIRLLGVFDGLGWLSLVGFVAFAVLAVRLFAAPALVVAGDDIRGAVRESTTRSAGEGATLFGLVLLLGISAWLLGSVPVVGALLSTAVVAPVHAVAAVVFAEEVGPRR
ncbi:hypothetical protein [Halorussus pelagicus]|uniref:hypothetical protein n=1 Tax=Halorussus pelagicus TaxID=2505977 RepID=UPI000FFC0797|nr:hypothetical protein [Halorussus pelagicus]